jgi:hypothetical protein
MLRKIVAVDTIAGIPADILVAVDTPMKDIPERMHIEHLSRIVEVQSPLQIEAQHGTTEYQLARESVETGPPAEEQ